MSVHPVSPDDVSATDNLKGPIPLSTAFLSAQTALLSAIAFATTEFTKYHYQGVYE